MSPIHVRHSPCKRTWRFPYIKKPPFSTVPNPLRPEPPPLPYRPTFPSLLMSIPESHPSVHEHKGKTCPVTGQSHEFCPPQQGDSRSPCPALNAMANHGYMCVPRAYPSPTWFINPLSVAPVMAKTSVHKISRGDSKNATVSLHPSLISYPMSDSSLSVNSDGQTFSTSANTVR